MWDTAEQAYVRPARQRLLAAVLRHRPTTPGVASAVTRRGGEALHASLRSRSALVVTCPAAPTRRAARTVGPRVRGPCRGRDRAAHRSDARARVDGPSRLVAGAASRRCSCTVSRPGEPRTGSSRTPLTASGRPVLADEQPLLLTDVAPLARYGQTARVAHLLDTAASRPAARWLLVPSGPGLPHPRWTETTCPWRPAPGSTSPTRCRRAHEPRPDP